MILHLFGSTNRDCSICKFFHMNDISDEHKHNEDKNQKPIKHDNDKDDDDADD